MTAKRITSLLLALVLMIAVAGCGDSDENSSDTASEKPNLKIGLEAPLTGDQAELGQGMLRGARLAAKEINDDGGVLGKQLEIVAIDDAADAETGEQAASAAIKAGLEGVVGPYNSGVGLKTLPLYIKDGLTPIRLTSDNATDGMGYTLQPMVDQIAPVTTDAITKWLKAKKVAIAYDSSTAYTKSVANEVKGMLEKAGVKITAFDKVKPGMKDYADEVKKLAASGADVIYAAVYFPEGGLIAKAIKSQKVNAKCLADYASYDSGFNTTAGSAAKSCSVVGVPAPDDFEDADDHVDAFEDEFDLDPGTWSPFTYDSVKLLAESAKKAGGFEATKLEPVLDAISGWKGWTGSVTLDAKTGNRKDAPVVVTAVDDDGDFHVDEGWARAVGAPY